MAQKFFHEPEELPGGFFEALQPLAAWVKARMREVYRLGYAHGKADSSSEWKEICDRIRKDEPRKPPPGPHRCSWPAYPVRLCFHKPAPNTSGAVFWACR